MSFTNKAAFIATSYAAFTAQDAQENKPTGLWLSEFTTPYYKLADQGIKIDTYSTLGGPIPLDPNSISRQGDNEDSVERYLNDKRLQTEFAQSKAIGSLNPLDYDVIFLPGGHGTMWDYPASRKLADIIAQSIDDDRILAAVCHGPAGLTEARDQNGKSILAGRKLTGFSNAEEQAVGMQEEVPFLLESKLRELGADYQCGPDFKPFVVQDGNLITGQNPSSAEAVATAIKETLNARNAYARKSA